MSNQLRLIICIGIVLLSVVISYSRIFFGIDLTDEAYYLAVPYSFILGNHPYLNEMSMQQSFGILLSPWIKLYTFFANGTTGVALYVRHLFFFLSFSTAVAAYRLFAQYLPRDLAYLLGAIQLAYIPHCIPTLSYNTLGSLLFSLGLYLALIAIGQNQENRSRHLYAALSGFALGSCAFSYFGFLPAIGVLGCIWVVFLSSPKRSLSDRSLFFVWIGALSATLMIAAVILYRCGFNNISASYRFANSFKAHGGGFDKLGAIFRTAWDWFPPLKWLGITLPISAIALFFNRKRFGMTVALFIPLWLAPLFKEADAHAGSHLFMPFYVLFGLPLVLSLRKKTKLSLLFFWLWVPSMVAALSVGWISSGGFHALAVGLMPAFLVTLAAAVSLRAHPNWFELYTPRLILISILTSLLYFQYAFVYRDDPIIKQDAYVQSGPFFGIKTSHAKEQFLAAFAQDIKLYSKNQSTVLFYDEFPGGYLFSALRPLTPLVWMPPLSHYPHDRNFYVDYFSTQDHLPDLVFEFSKFPLTSTLMNDLKTPHLSDAFEGFFLNRPGYRLVKETTFYRILAKAQHAPNPSARSPIESHE